MKPKKYTKVDLNKRTVIFLQIGLIVVLLFCYFSIEWKTYSQHPTEETASLTGTSEAEPEIPITITPTPPPPLPKAPDVIEVIKDDVPKIEDPVATTESNNEPIAEIKDIIEAPTKDKDPITVPFKFIEEVPIFPGCENLKTNAERRDCMSTKISQFVNKKFDTNLGSSLGLTGLNRITVIFKIDKTGHVTDIKSRATHPKLEEEANRLVSKLPKMEPGKQRGKPVSVSYVLPIVFQVQ